MFYIMIQLLKLLSIIPEASLGSLPVQTYIITYSKTHHYCSLLPQSSFGILPVHTYIVTYSNIHKSSWARSSHHSNQERCFTQ